MNRFSRRTFLQGGIAAAGLLAAGGAQAATGYRMGSQSYSFRNFDFEGSIAQLKALGLDSMEFCGVHFPADPNDPGLEKVKETIQAAGIDVPCYGVEGFSKDADANRKKFEFAKALGVGILTAHPDADSFDNLDELVAEYDIAIGIHNHGPKAKYDGVGDTLSAVKGRDARIGACLDTGHCIRSGEKPHETAEKLGDRLICMHLKDWKHGGEEQIIGEGDLDLVALAKVLKALNFDGPIMMEYENHPDNPVPHMATGWKNWQAAVTEVG